MSHMLSESREILYGSDVKMGNVCRQKEQVCDPDMSTDDEKPFAHCLDWPAESTVNNMQDDFNTEDEQPLCLLASTPKTNTIMKDSNSAAANESTTPTIPKANKKGRKHPKKGKPSKKPKLDASMIASDIYPSDNDQDDFSDISDIEVDTLSASSSESSDEEKDGDNATCGRQWVTKILPMKPKDFKGPIPGGVLTLPASSEPIDYFLQIFLNNIWKAMASASNAYVPIYEAKRRKLTGTPDDWTDTDFKEITDDDIKAFIGVQMAMALDPKPSVMDYWSTDPALGNDYLGQTMSRNRYNNILRYFHVNDPVKDPARIPNLNERKAKLEANPLYKVAPLLENVREKSKDIYNLHQQISIDEAIVKCHGQHWGIVGAPNKPAKRGFKILTVVDGTTGYISNFEVYLKNQREIGLTQRVVEDLCKEIQGRNHIVFVDKCYTSVPLAEPLLKNGTYICGSFNISRKQWPMDLKPDN